MQDGLRSASGLGATGINPYYCRCWRVRRRARALLTRPSPPLTRPIERARRAGNTWGEPDLLRIRGEFLLELGQRPRLPSSASPRRLPWRGRPRPAAGSCAPRPRWPRLWAAQGRSEEAKRLLAPVYQAFEEGFGTPDLQDARALLATLDAR